MNKLIYILLSLAIICSSCINNDSNKIKQEKIDLCRCLNESGVTKWSVDNKKACNQAINNKIGVNDWQSTNFSKNKDANIKWEKMVKDCVDHQMKKNIDDLSLKKISFSEAKKFIEERFKNIGQRYIDGKIIYSKKDIKAYYFLSQNIQYPDYYCITGVSNSKLEVLGDVNCGKNDFVLKFNNLE